MTCTGAGMARPQRAVAALLAALALVGGCAGPGLNKAGGPQARKPVVLTLAYFIGTSWELDGFAREVQRLSAGAMRIDIEGRWRTHQVDFETGLIGDVRAGKADLGVVGSEAWASVGVNSFRALNAPLLINSYALQGVPGPGSPTVRGSDRTIRHGHIPKMHVRAELAETADRRAWRHAPPLPAHPAGCTPR
jgi:hypothetical protein